MELVITLFLIGYVLPFVFLWILGKIEKDEEEISPFLSVCRWPILNWIVVLWLAAMIAGDKWDALKFWWNERKK